MNRICRFAPALPALAVMLMLPACEWESGDDFNTSRGAGIDVNFSGVYKGETAPLVEGIDIGQLVLTQTGNSLSVLANSVEYTGSVGSPGVASSPDAAGDYSAGASMLQAQVNFGGGNVSFVGVVRAVAVSDVQGTTSSSASGESSAEGTSDSTTSSDTSEITTETTMGGTTITHTSEDTTESSTEGSSSSGSDSSVINTTTFIIDQGNTMYVLEGNWMEGGNVHAVHGMAHALSGSFTVESADTGVHDSTRSAHEDITSPDFGTGTGGD